MAGPRQTKKGFDEIEHRFSDLLVNLSLVSEDKSDNSDSLFKDIKSCKNITFTRTRSKSYFEDIEIFPPTREDTPVKHALLTSDEEESCVKVNSSQHSPTEKNTNVYCTPRSPLKAYPVNSQATPKIVEKSKKAAERFLSGSAQRSINSNRAKFAISSLNISSPDESLSNKENSMGTKSSIVTPDIYGSSTTDSLCRQSPLRLERTPVSSKKGNHAISKTSTPMIPPSSHEPLIQNVIFKTPVSSGTIVKTPLSAQKRQSIDKAVASARREFEEMVRTIKLKKNTMKAKQKDGNDSIFYETCDLSVNSTARNSLFSTPTTADKTIEVKTPVSGMKPNKSVLTGVKKLDTNNKHSTVSETQSNNIVLSSRKDQTGPNDEDDDALPCTQPVSSILLHGVVAYVEVRFGKDYMSEGTKAELESLGAVVEKNFTRKVTHCFFHGGKMSTYRKAIEWKVPLVSTLWIEACKKEMQMVPLKGYSPHGLEKYKEDLPLYKLKTIGLRRAVTDSKVRRKPWKEEDLNKKSKQTVVNKRLPPAPIFKEADNVINALHTVAKDLRKATNQFEKILTSPVLQKKTPEEINKDGASVETAQETNTSTCRRKRNKKLIFGSSSDEDNKKVENNPVIETEDSGSRISDINDSEIRVSYDSDDLLVYAKKQAATSRCSAPPRLLTSRKCKKLLSSCKDVEKSKEVSSGARENKEKSKKGDVNTNITGSKNQPADGKRIRQELNQEKPTQTKKRRLLLPSQVIANFEQDSGESTPPASPRCPYKVTPNKKPKSGLAVKNRTVRALVNVKVNSDCDSDDSLTRAARRESSALFVKKEKKNIPQKTNPTIVCTSLSRSDEEVVKAIVAQLGTFKVEGTVSERTTHVVTPMPRRTINLLKGIARGCWVLNVQWVFESLEVGQWLPEERFELTQFSPAVKMARCDRQAFGPEFGLELFTGLGPFYVCRGTVPPSRDLAELLRLGGGCVVSNARAAKVVIGRTPPLLSPGNRTPPLIVREKWVLDSITRMSQLDMADYAVLVDPEP